MTTSSLSGICRCCAIPYQLVHCFSVENCISSGQADNIDVSVDGGKWYKIKCGVSSAEQVSNRVPLLPITGWKPFPSVTIPENFNTGHMYHHIVESVENVNISLSFNHAQSDVDDSEAEDDGKDIHTSKPLKKGKIYYTSGHVNNIVDQKNDDHYFVKCTVMSSYKPEISYNVTCTMSCTTGFIKDATCTCKASALGRCNHVTGLLYAIPDYIDKFGAEPTASTSQPQTWNVGRKKKKNPQALHKADYTSYKRRKISAAYDFDPRPQSLRQPPSKQMLNNYIKNLQSEANRNQNGELCMIASILKVHYDDYNLSDYEKEVLEVKVLILRQHLHSARTGKPVEVCPEQKSSKWQLERRCRITASECHRICHLKSATATTNFLREKLWNTNSVVSSKAMLYGNVHEADARNQYLKDCQSVNSDYNVIPTGLWASDETPELACSPDGLVKDPQLCDHELGMYGLLEIKCPIMLKNKDIKQFERLLTKEQLSHFSLKRRDGTIVLKKEHCYFY